MTVENILVTVHGALSTQTSFTYLAGGLKKKLDKTWLIDSDFSYDVKVEHASDIVLRLKAYITELREKHLDLKTIVLLGHSFGGVLSCDVAKIIDVTEVISLAAPFGGSGPASLLRLLKPSSILLCNIGAYDSYIRSFNSTPLAAPLLAILATTGSMDISFEAKNDGVVTIASQVHLQDDPHCMLTDSGMNHFEILLSDAVVSEIADNLNSL